MIKTFSSRRNLVGWVWLTLFLGLAPFLKADPPPPAMAARFLKAISMGLDSSAKVMARDSALVAELKNQGVVVDQAAKVAWATSEAEVKFYAGQQKLVVAPSVELLGQGAAIALLVEGGKLNISYNIDNAKKAGQTIPDLVLKMGTAR